MTPALLLQLLIPAQQPPSVPPPPPPRLHNSAEDAGDAEGQCGSPKKLKVGDRTLICIGFLDEDYRTPVLSGGKAGFYPRVDEYAAITVDSLEPIVQSRDWATMRPYRYMWMGLHNKRTVGQQRGIVDGDGECRPSNSTSDDGDVCYGWSLHNKPVYNADNFMVTSITALIHLDRGEVKKIQWDVSCNLCHSGKELLCLDDNTTETCYDREGDCNDCYLLIGQGCGEGGIRCAPKVHLAWIGTDANGHNLLSSGSILSSFSDYALSPVIDSSYEGIKGSLDGDE